MTMEKDKKEKTREQQLEQEIEELKKRLDEKPPVATKEEVEAEEPPLTPTPPATGIAQFMGGGTLKTAIISFLVTILVVTGLGTFGGGNFVTKNDFTRNIQDVISAIDTVQTGIADDQQKVNDAVAQIPGQVTNAVNQQIGSLRDTVQASSTQVSDLTSRVDTLNSNISGFSSTLATLTDKINTLEDQVADYEDRIAELESQPSTPTSDGVARSGDITADIDWDDDWQIGSDNASIICLFRLKVYNDTDEVLEDLWLDFDYNWDGYITGGGFGAKYMEVDGRSETTQYDFVFDDVKLRNIDIDPGDHDRFYCELTVNYAYADLTWEYVDDNWDIDFDPEVDITDYEFD